MAAVEIAGPGFLNITVEADAQGEVAADIVAAGRAYGHTDTLAASGSTSSSSPPTRPARCTSATPAGPRSATRSRRVLEAAGAEVTREFYINDRGNQMDLFGASIEAAALGQPVPEDGYHGGYIADLAAAVVAENPGHPRPARRASARWRSARPGTPCS